MQGVALPESLVLGPGDAKGRMEGSHVNPVIQATWQVPAAEASGHVKLDKDTMHLSSKYATFTIYLSHCNRPNGHYALRLYCFCSLRYSGDLL